jgi:hypothetical protein
VLLASVGELVASATRSMSVAAQHHSSHNGENESRVRLKVAAGGSLPLRLSHELPAESARLASVLNPEHASFREKTRVGEGVGQQVAKAAQVVALPARAEPWTTERAAGHFAGAEV